MTAATVSNFTPTNMDRLQRCVIETAKCEWLPSPSKGVWRKPLEREAAEHGQVTSIVRYEPGTFFSAHTHTQGEEIFVLSGIFEDENGSYPAGTYLRNPPGSSHTPGSSVGCELWVKLNMFDMHDQEKVVLNTHEASWLPGLVDGLTVMPLHNFTSEATSAMTAEHTALVRWQKGTHFSPHRHMGGEEIFVLEGTFEDEFGQYPTGTWIRSPHESKHQPFSDEGCLILVKVGHLARLAD
ncbi:cupin domain-containing protein [Neptunomonas antarctica]|uniref:Anti-ECFsigma factor, ChrR n=1 Tax=Neptunomonas antarctica TaxID=619304 RepID=A0A1N7L4V2_9GAMM|nr:cupin domain-containing protein [Neptunomonas antarctica]SIS68844.1 anti-ECFsigma factor, ChrR [Neptunomonas antarctica]